MLRSVLIVALGVLLCGCRCPVLQEPPRPPQSSDEAPERDNLSADDDVDPRADAGAPSQGN